MNLFSKSQTTRRTRRAWVLTACADILLLSFLAVSGAVGLHVVFIVGVVPIIIALGLRRVQVASLPGGQPDERQLDIKHRAYTLAYRIGFVLAVIAALSLYSVKVYTDTAFWGLFYGYFVLLSTLPTLAFAWLEPDPPGDDVELSPGIARAL